MTSFLLNLSGCSNKPPETITEVVYQKQYMPLGLLVIDCQEQPPGLTVRSLGSSWVNNTGCLRAHQKLIEGIKENYTKEGLSDGESRRER